MAETALLDFLESELFKNASSNTTRLATKLKTAVKNRERYETHQILRTIYFRYIADNQKLAALKDLLFHGSCFLLENDEDVSGQDIGCLFLETTTKILKNYRNEVGDDSSAAHLADPALVKNAANKTLYWDTCKKVAQIATKLPDTEVGLTTFIAETLRILSPKLLNRELLHNVLAEEFATYKQYNSSRYHYLHCANMENATKIASLLAEYQTSKSTTSEIEIFIMQFIFQYLCLQNPLDCPKPSSSSNSNRTVMRRTRNAIKTIALEIFTGYTSEHPTIKQACIPYSAKPLLNFTYFIISILDANGEARTFEFLRDVYKAVWTRDPNFHGYLQRIGVLYFGIVDQSKQRQGGFLNNILLPLLEGADENEEESADRDSFISSDELD